jgi:predicted nucleic acid-binding protein
MSGYLLDTNHLSRLIDQRFSIRARVLDARVQGDTFHVVAPLITETIAGFSILPRAARNWSEWRLARPALELLPIDEEDAESAALLQVTLRRAGRQLATIDALAAAVALRYGLTVLTTDRDFSAVPDPARENWTATP